MTDEKRTRFHALAEELEPAPAFCNVCTVLLGETDYATCKRCRSDVSDFAASAFAGIDRQVAAPVEYKSTPLTEETIAEAAAKLLGETPRSLQRSWQSPMLVVLGVAYPVHNFRAVAHISWNNGAQVNDTYTVQFRVVGEWTPEKLENAFVTMFVSGEDEPIVTRIHAVSTTTTWNSSKVYTDVDAIQIG